MQPDRKAAEMALALMYLTSIKENGGGVRAWKGLPWELADHLFEKSYIRPLGKGKSRCGFSQVLSKRKPCFQD